MHRSTVAAIALGAGLLWSSAPAWAQSATTYLDVGAGLGYSTNPYLAEGDDQESAFGRVFLQGVHSILTERTKWTLSGYAENTSYLTDHDSSQLANLSAAVLHQASERVNVFGDVRFSMDAGGQLLSRFVEPGIPVPTGPVPTGPGTTPIGTPPGTTPTVPLNPDQSLIYDPAIFGTSRRQYAVSGQLGATFEVSARDSLTLSGGAQHIFFGGNDTQSNYTTYHATGAWDRQLTERTTVGAGLSAHRTEYSDIDDRSTVLNPFVRVSTALSEGWNANVTAGATFFDQDVNGDSNQSTGLSFYGSLCKAGENSSFCIDAGRSIEPSTLGRAFTTTSLGMHYSQRLNRTDTLELSSSVYRYRGEDEVADLSDSEFAALDARYSREFSPRFFAGVTAGVRGMDRREFDTQTDVSGSLFLRYRIGDVR